MAQTSKGSRKSMIDASQIEISGLPRLPEGMVTEGVEIIVRVRSR